MPVTLPLASGTGAFFRETAKPVLPYLLTLETSIPAELDYARSAHATQHNSQKRSRVAWRWSHPRDAHVAMQWSEIRLGIRGQYRLER